MLPGIVSCQLADPFTTISGVAYIRDLPGLRLSRAGLSEKGGQTQNNVD
jgi:hypothetical protein